MIALGNILVGGRSSVIPTRGSGVGAAVQIHKAQLVLCLGMPLLGRAPQPDDTIAGAGDDPFATQIKQTQPIRALGLAGSGSPLEELECLREVALGASVQPAAYGPAQHADPIGATLRFMHRLS